MIIVESPTDLTANLSDETILKDYQIAYISRQASLVGRREVLSGRGKFGIFGDGKELAQLAMAHAFEKGDWRSGYYRDQTLMMALGETDVFEFFAQLYAHADVNAEPNSAGRQMNAHYASRLLNPDGSWKDQTQMYNTTADMSPTAAQMPRLVGLGLASKLYRELVELPASGFSKNGNEVAFGTIGNASSAEGHFWETVNAVGVLDIPVIISIWDDGYGISVPNEYQITKGDLSEVLSGFQREGDGTGFDIYRVEGWDYGKLVETYQQAAANARESHTPAIIHVTEVTQPQGHSTSGSHERYKSKERLAWEVEFDGLVKMRAWILDEELTSADALEAMENEVRQMVYSAKDQAWAAVNAPMTADAEEVGVLIEAVAVGSEVAADILKVKTALLAQRRPARHMNTDAAHEVLVLTKGEASEARSALLAWKNTKEGEYRQMYGSFLYSGNAEKVAEVKPIYSAESPIVSGFQILNAGFDLMLARDPRVIAFGEDLGYIGGVNQAFAGLQKKHGERRVSDVGIREATIIGQGTGLALRGLRPIAEIQYLDYFLYALQQMSDDVATLHWRTAGGQSCPLIVRTRGHRLEGVWHSGSPMGGLTNLVHGVNVCVPRDMVRAIGFYNTLLEADEPGVVVEVLNGYRLKEKMPDNIGDVKTPLGIPEIIHKGEDVTVVTYGACVNIAKEGAEMLERVGISLEIIDIQTLIPFDTPHQIVKSLEKTSRIIFMDEDVPGGTTATMMQHVLEDQNGFQWLDSDPVTLSAAYHRTAYGADGGYFSKPNATDLFNSAYALMHEADPTTYPNVF